MAEQGYGVVDYFNLKKFFGFILETTTGRSYFFHGTNLTKNSAPAAVGRAAVFTRTETSKGYVALDVCILNTDVEMLLKLAASGKVDGGAK